MEKPVKKSTAKDKRIHEIVILGNVSSYNLRVGKKVITNRDLPECHKDLKKHTWGEIIAVINRMNQIIVMGFHPEDDITDSEFEKQFEKKNESVFPFS